MSTNVALINHSTSIYDSSRDLIKIIINKYLDVIVSSELLQLVSHKSTILHHK